MKFLEMKELPNFLSSVNANIVADGKVVGIQSYTLSIDDNGEKVVTISGTTNFQQEK